MIFRHLPDKSLRRGHEEIDAVDKCFRVENRPGFLVEIEELDDVGDDLREGEAIALGNDRN